jgi:ParB-like chromosome segregation protein Spo0J
MKYTQHPLSSAFPAMTENEFQELKDSIEVNGVLNAITIYEDMVIDGWHRYKAANDLGMDCPETELDESIDPKDFVLAQNKNRRHITVAQLAIATAQVYEWHPANRPNKGAGTAHLLKTTAELAEISGASERTIKQAKAVLRDASPEVQEAVKSGKIGLEKAQKLSKLPKDQQAGAIDKALPKEAPEKPNLAQYYGPDEAELKANEMALQADIEAMNKLLESDDALATAHAEIKRLNLAYAQLDIRFKGLMNEKSEAVRLLQKAQSEIKALRKAQK